MDIIVLIDQLVDEEIILKIGQWKKTLNLN